VRVGERQLLARRRRSGRRPCCRLIEVDRKKPAEPPTGAHDPKATSTRRLIGPSTHLCALVLLYPFRELDGGKDGHSIEIDGAV